MSVFLETLVRAQPSPQPAVSLGTELLSFLAVGGGVALAYVLLVNGLVGLDIGVADWQLSVLCYAAMIGPAYLLHRRFSFQSNAPHAKALPRYVAVQLCALALASLFSFVAFGLIGLSPLTASILVLCLTSGVNFIVLRLWAFTHRS